MLKMGMDQVKLVGAIINIAEHWEVIAESQLQPNLVLPGGELVEIRLPMSLAPSKRLKRRASHHGRASPAPQTATQLLFPSHHKVLAAHFHREARHARSVTVCGALPLENCCLT